MDGVTIQAFCQSDKNISLHSLRTSKTCLSNDNGDIHKYARAFSPSLTSCETM